MIAVTAAIPIAATGAFFGSPAPASTGAEASATGAATETAASVTARASGAETLSFESVGGRGGAFPPNGTEGGARPRLVDCGRASGNERPIDGGSSFASTSEALDRLAT